MAKYFAWQGLQVVDGQIGHAALLKRIFGYASHGLSDYLWTKDAGPGVDLEQMVLNRMKSRIADPKYRLRIASVDVQAAGGVISLDIGSEPESTEGMSPLLKALVEGENSLLNSHYINAIAVFPEFRGKGVAERLILDAAGATSRPLSLIVADTNRAARSVYKRLGFEEVSRHTLEKEDWDGEGDWWIAMRRDV